MEYQQSYTPTCRHGWISTKRPACDHGPVDGEVLEGYGLLERTLDEVDSDNTKLRLENKQLQEALIDAVPHYHVIEIASEGGEAPFVMYQIYESWRQKEIAGGHYPPCQRCRLEEAGVLPSTPIERMDDYARGEGE